MNAKLKKEAAQKMLQLHKENKEHEKRAYALRLIYKQAELGFGDVPRSYRELQEKVASLMNQDLCVVDKALDLTGGNMKLGELGQMDHSASSDAAEQFQAAIIGEL